VGSRYFGPASRECPNSSITTLVPNASSLLIAAIRTNTTRAMTRIDCMELKMPVLVVNGSDDVLTPPRRSWKLMQKIPGAQLIICPHAGHTFLYQYAELVATHINMFLNGNEYGELGTKL
jgi:pimeloyl-ACP methyl ester carboxylesterase